MNESFEISMMPCGALTAHSKRIFAEVFRKMGEPSAPKGHGGGFCCNHKRHTRRVP